MNLKQIESKNQSLYKRLKELEELKYSLDNKIILILWHKKMMAQYIKRAGRERAVAIQIFNPFKVTCDEHTTT